MAASLLFSPDMISICNNESIAPKQARALSSPNHLDHWLSQQQAHRSTQHETPRTMSATSTNNNNTHDNDNESYSHSNPRVDDLEYTFTTHGPNDDYIWPHTGSPFSMPLNIQTGGRLARASPSPGYSEHWQSPEYNSYNSQNEQSSNSPTFLLNNYSPDSALGPYGVHSRSPHISPTGSDPTLSPLYSSSPHLSPSTPNSSFMPSPTLTDINHLVMIDQSTIGSSDPKLCYTHREQLLKFREALSLPMPGAGPFVPQPMYKPHTTSDRKRYVEEVMLEAPMFFISEHPEQYGISLKDALHSRTKKLRDRDMVVFEGRGPSVSIRLEWPGYRQWSRQIPTKDFRSPPQPITLAKLAKNVAKCVQRFMQDRKHLPMEEESDHRWKIGDGPDDIKLEDLILVSIHHVSLGSWQPHLRLVRPLRQQRYGNGHGHGQSHSLSVPQMPPTPMTASNSSPSTISFSQLS